MGLGLLIAPRPAVLRDALNAARDLAALPPLIRRFTEPGTFVGVLPEVPLGDPLWGTLRLFPVAIVVL